MQRFNFSQLQTFIAQNVIVSLRRQQSTSSLRRQLQSLKVYIEIFVSILENTSERTDFFFPKQHVGMLILREV